MKKHTAAGLFLAAAVIGMIFASPIAARDAAFMEPTSGAGGAGDEAIRAEPKGEIDIGETNVNMARRVTLFFANASNVPVQVEKVNANSDANVITEIANDDCSKQGTIAPDSRCTVELSITPTSPGTWAVEVLMTHNGAGRIARAKVSGKTSGTIASGDRKETGLDMSSKEVTPINFGELEVNGKAVRSALMVNDSPDPITILSIDVIEATNGLSLLDQGCSVDLELKPGETCPVTLLWAPTDEGRFRPISSFAIAAARASRLSLYAARPKAWDWKPRPAAKNRQRPGINPPAAKLLPRRHRSTPFKKPPACRWFLPMHWRRQKRPLLHPMGPMPFALSAPSATRHCCCWAMTRPGS